MKLQYLDVRGGAKDIENAFREASKARADALLLLPSFVFNSYRTEIAAIAVKSRLPTVSQKEFVEEGGLVSYGTSYTDLFRRAATYVDKILKGAKPADLPIEQPTKFDLVINLKSAKAIGLTIPLSILVRADQVFE